jgi:hypothetical protein
VRAFTCPHCHALVAYENSLCLTCGSALGYLRSAGDFVVIDQRAGYRPCANLSKASCNWVAEVDSFCWSCALTRTRPADSDPLMPAFALAETAKRRLLFQLESLRLPVITRTDDPAHGLVFDMLSSSTGPVTTGHASGVITLDLAEGDDAHREGVRQSLGEPYRTVLGHLRHEIGHWYWDVLVLPNHLPTFRLLFGDERADYAQALSGHYGAGESAGWQVGHVSDYAAAHPWEDWAETFAHYLHIRDTLQTAAAYGMKIDGPNLPISSAAPLSAEPEDETSGFGEIIRTWLPMTYALNGVNRSMGKEDLYPFVLTPRVLSKLRFVHAVISEATISRNSLPPLTSH